MLMPHLVRKYKLVFFILIEILLIYLIYILKVTPGCSGYEPSIYAKYPATFWLIYFVIYLFSLSTLVYSIFVKPDRLFSYASLFNLVILSLILLLLPFFRGYFSIGLGDSTYHLTTIEEILSAHHFGGVEGTREDPYPITHMLSAGILLITLMKLETIGQVTPVLYHIAYVSFIYLLGRELYKNNKKSMFLLLFALLPILKGYYYYPSLMFLHLIPMLAYAFMMGTGKASVPFRYIILILVLNFPFLHPASSLLLLIFFAVIYLVGHILHAGKVVLRSYQTAPLLFLVIWLLWSMSLEGHFAPAIRHYVDWFVSPLEQPSYYKTNVAGLAVAQLSLGDTILLYIKRYGSIHLLFGLASVFSLHTLVYNWIKKKTDRLNTALSLICLVYVALYIVGFFFTLTLLGARIEPYAVLISLLVIASFLFNLVSAYQSDIKRVVSLTLIVILLLSMTYVSTFSFYDSPFNRDSPQHCTYMELDSMAWFLQTRDRNLDVEDLNLYHLNVARYLVGCREAPLEPHLKNVRSPQTLPPHFNYDNESLLAKTLKKDCYLINNKKNELISVNIYAGYEERWNFHPDDYKKLESDKSLDKIYHNGEIKIFYVNGQKWSEAD